MAKDGLDGLGKMRGNTERPSYTPKSEMISKKADSIEGEHAQDNIHEVHDHGDGTFHTIHPDGSREEHPDHLHMLASLGHNITGGDKHHIVHHDGISAHSHSISEDGQHEDHGEATSPEESHSALDKFLGEESKEPQHQGQSESDEGPVMGGI